MILDCSHFEKGIVQLEKSLAFYRSELAEKNSDLKEQFRSAIIQAFEFTYELAIKMIRRQLEQIVANPSELREMAFMDLLRTASRLLSGGIRVSYFFPCTNVPFLVLYSNGNI